MPPQVDRIQRLIGNVLWALDHSLPAAELVPMLEQLLVLAPPRSAGARLAKHHLSRLIVATQPWRAARLAGELLSDPSGRAPESEDGHWAVLGMAHTVMGNYRLARRAHLKALQLAPHAPSHLHNLGHLLDVAFDRPNEALRYLRAAHDQVPDEPELASSYAHALVRSGLTDQARGVLRDALGSDEQAERLMARWAHATASAAGLKPLASDQCDDDLEVAEG